MYSFVGSVGFRDVLWYFFDVCVSVIVLVFDMDEEEWEFIKDDVICSLKFYIRSLLDV